MVSHKYDLEKVNEMSLRHADGYRVSRCRRYIGETFFQKFQTSILVYSGYALWAEGPWRQADAILV